MVIEGNKEGHVIYEEGYGIRGLKEEKGRGEEKLWHILNCERRKGC
jgi:hypothetical protein